MCGRFTISVNKEELSSYLKEHYDINNDELNVGVPRYNVSPGQEIITVLNDGSRYRVGHLKWGLVPSWASDEKIGYKMINAKAETISQKPFFKHSLLNKRCVILADSFYEWKREHNAKIPIRIQLKTSGIFSFAGLWSTFVRHDGSKLHTCTVITTSPNDLVTNFHDRMPVILDQDSERIWLNPEVKDTNKLNALLVPLNSHLMEAYQVSSLVNNSKNENALCIKPIV